MDYQKIYNRLIERGKTREKLDCYIEKHHIIPRCMNGPDTPENLVELTPEEHYLAHQLLVKIHPGHMSLLYSAKMMCMNVGGQRSNNKLHGWLKRKYSTLRSLEMAGKSIRPAGWHHTAESRAKITKAVRARKHTPESKAKISKKLLGHSFSDESIARMTKSRTGVKWTEERKLRAKGRKLSAAHKANISAGLLKEKMVPSGQV